MFWSALRSDWPAIALCLAGGVVCVVGIMVELGPANFDRGGWTIGQWGACVRLMLSARSFYLREEIRSSQGATQSRLLYILALGAVFFLVSLLSSLAVASIVPVRVGWIEVSWASAAATAIAALVILFWPSFWK